MKVLILAACLAVWASANTLVGKNAQFEAFKRKFGKTYKSAVEEKFRLKTFMTNLKAIEAHNKLHEAGEVSFTTGVNKFADRTSRELSETYNGLLIPANFKPKTNVKPAQLKDVPDSINWCFLGCCTGLKDQGQCRASWAFCATESIECQHKIATGTLVSLSEQNLIDCSWDYGNAGCEGGWVDQAFQYVIDNKGIDTEASYPYEDRVGVCRYSATNSGATISNYQYVPSKDEGALKQASGTIGLINAAIDASHASFQLYTGGVYYEPLCSEYNLNLVVLVVGYGTEDGEDYWLVKNNNYGPFWGEDGYIKMSRNRNNNCGIATYACYPIV